MFFKLISRNSKRNRKSNLLYFSSMVISIVAFYIILSLEHQDVIIFLKTLEKDAINKLLNLIPVLYGTTLFILFFLVYFAVSLQLDSRKHEFGVYLTLGMKRSKLFILLILEDLRNNFYALIVGLPVAIILSEIISLVTAKIVGLNIIGHHFSLSIEAVVLTLIGFIVVKMIALILLSSKIVSKEIGQLLYSTPVGNKRQLPKLVYIMSLIIGSGMLFKAYRYGLDINSWESESKIAWIVVLGCIGTILFFYGLRIIIGMIITLRPNAKLHTYNFRQLQEMVIHRSTILAICSLLMFMAVCFLGVGRVSTMFVNNQSHVMDYTFVLDKNKPTDTLSLNQVNHQLKRLNVKQHFSQLFELKIGNVIHVDEKPFINIVEKIKALPNTPEKQLLLNHFEHANSYFINLSGYNEIRKAAGLAPISLKDNEILLYRNEGITTGSQTINKIIQQHPKVTIGQQTFTLTGEVQSLPIVTDRAITLFTSFIVTDQVFDKYVKPELLSVYINGVLDEKMVEKQGLMSAMMEINKQIDKTSYQYESYIKNIGIRLFLIVATSYLTIYLALVLLVIANTIIGVQFLMGQRNMNKRYQTLIHLGADYKTLYRAANKQIHWYFGLPIFMAILSSIFGIKSLLVPMVPLYGEGISTTRLFIILTAISVLVVVELIYIQIVKLQSKHYLRTLMQPKRQE